MIRRDEITHRVLGMVDFGQVSRNPIVNSCRGWTAVVGWDINIDARPAPETAYWALTTLEKLGLIGWWDLRIGIHLAVITAAGLHQLKAWDTDLLGPPLASSRPLAGMDIAALDAEAARLIGTVNFPKDQH